MIIFKDLDIKVRISEKNHQYMHTIDPDLHGWTMKDLVA
jgi:hypothetical protein